MLVANMISVACYFARSYYLQQPRFQVLTPYQSNTPFQRYDSPWTSVLYLQYTMLEPDFTRAEYKLYITNDLAPQCALDVYADIKRYEFALWAMSV